jgi:hypothetical protein
LEVIMSTTSITHRPTSFVTAAAAVLALAVGGVAWSLSQEGGNPAAPAEHSLQSQVQPASPQTHHGHGPAVGGHVMIGQ